MTEHNWGTEVPEHDPTVGDKSNQHFSLYSMHATSTQDRLVLCQSSGDWWLFDDENHWFWCLWRIGVPKFIFFQAWGISFKNDSKHLYLYMKPNTCGPRVLVSSVSPFHFKFHCKTLNSSTHGRYMLQWHVWVFNSDIITTAQPSRQDSHRASFTAQTFVSTVTVLYRINLQLPGLTWSWDQCPLWLRSPHEPTNLPQICNHPKQTILGSMMDDLIKDETSVSPSLGNSLRY